MKYILGCMVLLMLVSACTKDNGSTAPIPIFDQLQGTWLYKSGTAISYNGATGQQISSVNLTPSTNDRVVFLANSTAYVQVLPLADSANFSLYNSLQLVFSFKSGSSQVFTIADLTSSLTLVKEDITGGPSGSIRTVTSLNFAK